MCGVCDRVGVIVPEALCEERKVGALSTLNTCTEIDLVKLQWCAGRPIVACIALALFPG